MRVILITDDGSYSSDVDFPRKPVNITKFWKVKVGWSERGRSFHCCDAKLIFPYSSDIVSESSVPVFWGAATPGDDQGWRSLLVVITEAQSWYRRVEMALDGPMNKEHHFTRRLWDILYSSWVADVLYWCESVGNRDWDQTGLLHWSSNITIARRHQSSWPPRLNSCKD